MNLKGEDEMKINYNQSVEDIVAFNIYHLNHSQTGKKAMLVQRLLGPIIFFFMFFIANKISDIPAWYWGISFSIVGILWVIFYPKSVEKQVEKRVRKMIEEDDNKGLIGDRVLELSEKGIDVTTDYSSVNYSWESVNKIEQDRKYIYIYQSSMSAVMLPKSIFDTEEDMENVIKTIRNFSGK